MLPTDAVLFANEKEAAILTGAPGGAAADLAALLAGAGAGRQVVVTAGSGDAAWSDGDGAVSRAAEPLDRPELDTTGAGDAFAAGFLSAWPGPPEAALAAGARLAAEAIALHGARPMIDRSVKGAEHA
jgi:sugar/nucleoside kinase (ribokinase family)